MAVQKKPNTVDEYGSEDYRVADHQAWEPETPEAPPPAPNPPAPPAGPPEEAPPPPPGDYFPDGKYEPPRGPTQPSFTTGMTPDQVRKGVSDYFAYRGVSPLPTSVDYWVGKWGEWGNRDPNYFQQRLSIADEFGGGPQGPSPASPAAAPASNPFQDQIRQIILAQLQDLSKPYDPNADPVYGQTMGAARNEAQRAREQQQKAIAERLAAQGYSVAGGGGALADEMASAFDQQTGQLSSLGAQMVQRTLQDRRQQLQTTLSMAMQSGDAEAARAVQLQIAAIDSELRRTGLSEQGRQFDANLNEQRYQYDQMLPYYYTR